MRKNGLLWRVSEGEEKLAKEKQLNADRQKDWTAACERSNRELKAARDEVVKIKAKKSKESQEYERLSIAHKEKEAESQARILLAEDLGGDCKWLLARAALAKEKDHQFELFKVDCKGNYTAKRKEYEYLEFGILKAIEKSTRRGIAVETLKKVLEDADAEAEAGGAGTSHQVLRMNGGCDRLLYLIDPAVQFVVTSLGGLQCLFCHLFRRFVQVCLKI
ncbi:hypothetical protein HanPI659440_Chr09g0350761 [Helianthus annuus]|nr:hypothetical protein HanPI659440_Chr09g0350761 [Helianthus annuus]